MPSRWRLALLPAYRVIAATGVVFQLDQTLGRDVLQQLGETRVAVVAFVESRIDAPDRLFECRAPHGVIVLFDGLQHLQKLIRGFLFLVSLLLLFFGVRRLFFAARTRSS